MKEHELHDDCWCEPDNIPVPREDGSIGWVVVHKPISKEETS